MQLYTVSINKQDYAEIRGIELYDVTVKSGDKRFAPNWDFLMSYKRGEINEEEYTEKFYTLMRDSFSEHKGFWLDLLSKESLAIACYCKAGKFCHRHLLVSIFEKVCKQYNIPFNYKGELN